MSLLARVKIITKILAVILLLGAVAVGTSWLGIRAMSSMNDDAETMTSAAKRALEAARASTSVISLNSAEGGARSATGKPRDRTQDRRRADEAVQGAV
jgi:methyl-accepting chemotaxis protein